MKDKTNLVLLFFMFAPLMCLAVFIFPNFCFAESDNYKNLVITEIMYDPKGPDTNQTDWIELYNPTSISVSLKKASFGIIDEEKLELASDKIHYLNCHKIESDIDIQPNSYVVLADNKEKFISTYLYTKNVFDSTFNFSSEGDFIKLSGDRCATFFIDFSYKNSWGGKDNGKTIEKINFDQKYGQENWQESCIDSGTPGKDNSKKSDCPILEEKKNLALKITKDDDIYKNIYANFEVNYAGATEATKYTWNFGDGHKSYLQKTRHKYEETGTYQASITIRGDKKDLQNFTVDVEDYLAPKVKIISLVPNPKGKDSKESIVIENKSKRKINLKGWSIATGWKSLINHPIREDFIVKPGKNSKLTKKICAFTLNNTQSKIELRYPNGNIAQKLKYNRKKDKIEDDEVFQRMDKNWTWNKPQGGTKENQNDTAPPAENDSLIENAMPQENTSNDVNIPEKDIQIDKSEFEAGLGKYSENPNFIAKKQNRIQLISYSTRINTPALLLDSPGKVAGAYMEKTAISEKHCVIKLMDWAWANVNLSVNLILNKL